jgi:HEAT repeats
MRRLLLLVLLALPLTAQEEEMYINMRLLSPDEFHVYRYVNDVIAHDLGATSGDEDTIAAVLRLQSFLDSLGVHDDVRSSLRDDLTEQLWSSACASPALVRRLLATNDATLQELALAGFHRREEPWIDDDDLRRVLLRTFDDPKTTDDVRESIVGVFFGSSDHARFPEIETRARRLAARHGDLAHSVAMYIALAEGDGQNEAVLRRLLDAPERAVREQAAIFLAGLDADDVVPRILAVAEDEGESPGVRGDAIRTLVMSSKRDRAYAAVLELLDRRHWFYGAPGSHFPVHSLALLIDGLRDDRATLEALRREVATLPDGQREFVEWRLDDALGRHVEVFRGPVAPVPR